MATTVSLSLSLPSLVYDAKLSANVPEKPGTSITKADNEGLFIHPYNGEGVSGRSVLLQDKTEIFRVVAVYNFEDHQPWEYVPLINWYEVYEITSDVQTESLNDVRSIRFEDITAVTRKIILHWYVTSVVCPKDRGRISPTKCWYILPASECHMTEDGNQH